MKVKALRVKKDIIIPAGTILESCPEQMERLVSGAFEVVIGLTPNSHGYFTYLPEREDFDEYFDQLDENRHCDNPNCIVGRLS